MFPSRLAQVLLYLKNYFKAVDFHPLLFFFFFSSFLLARQGVTAQGFIHIFDFLFFFSLTLTGNLSAGFMAAAVTPLQTGREMKVNKFGLGGELVKQPCRRLCAITPA